MSPGLEELQEVLDQLTIDYGKWKNNSQGFKYRAIDNRNMLEVIGYMVNTMKERGKEKDYFSAPQVKDFVAEYFFPEQRTEHKTAKQRKGCLDMVKGQLRLTVQEVWPTDVSSKTTEASTATVVESVRKTPTIVRELEPLVVRPDVSETPYEAQDTTVLDEDFMNELKEIADE